jgi:poly-gamma-glutamate synthesis protein (capsule biosynthesis protein)
MNKLRFRTYRQGAWWILALALGVGILLAPRATLVGFANLAYAQKKSPARGSEPLPTQFLDLGMKIKEPFTFAGVGDLIMRHPMGQLADPKFQALVQHLRDADVAFANMEGTLVDFHTFLNPISDAAPKAALADIKGMGIRLMGTANNHTWDSGEPGIFETIKNLDEGGIIHAGSGRNLQEARAASFFNGPKGTVGLVAMWSIDPTDLADRASATYRNGDRGRAPGLNGLHVTPYHVVTAEQMDALRKIRDSVYARRSEVPSTSLAIPPVAANEPPDRLQLFGTWYKVGPKPGNVSYVMDPQDEREILRSIRDGKENADFMVAAVHCHQANYDFQAYSFDNDVPDFLEELAHKAIDDGADVFIAEGVHTLRGVEIYKGKPIFYGVNSFISQGIHGISSEPANPSEGPLTDTESSWRPQRYHPDNLEVLMVTARYEGGKLVEVRLYPGDLGLEVTRPHSRLGLPMTPAPEMAQKILEKVQRISKPFGTTISIENNVGVIRVAPG